MIQRVPEPALVIDGVGVKLGDRTVLDDVTLSAERGETVALVGPNGSGKTTVLRAVVGLVPLAAGSVEAPSIDQGRLGATTGDPAFIPWMTPSAFGKMLLESAGEGDLGRVRRGLDEVGLDRRTQRRRLSRLSQGQRALAAISCALMRSPTLVLLDEPFAHLDRENATRVAAILRRRAAEGCAVLYTCHQLSDLKAADRVVGLEGGRVTGHWSPDDDAVVQALR